MDCFELKTIARRVGSELMDDLKAGKHDKIGRDEIEVACDASIAGLDAHDRETLIGLACRRVVDLSA